MSIVLVTRNQFIRAQKIHHITLNEETEYRDLIIKGRHNTVREVTNIISIIYTPESTNNTVRDDIRECRITIIAKVDAHKLFQSLVKQIREQMPDALFLNQAMEEMLKDSILELKECDDESDFLVLKEDSNDRSSTKVRSTRKKKRRSKKVLRRAKRRN